MNSSSILKNTSDTPTYSDILDKIRKETVQKHEAGVDAISQDHHEAAVDDM